MESAVRVSEQGAQTRRFPPRPVLTSLFLHALFLAAWEPPAAVVSPPAVLHVRLLPAGRAAASSALPDSSPPPPAAGVAAPPRLARAGEHYEKQSVSTPSAADLAVVGSVSPAPTSESESASAETFPPPGALAPQGNLGPVASPGKTLAAAPPSAAPDAAGLRQFRLALASVARRFRHYPDEARRAGLTGMVEVTVAVAADEGARRVELSRSSGQQVLDAAALEMIRAAAAHTEIPASLRGRDFAVHLPVIFEVEE